MISKMKCLFFSLVFCPLALIAGLQEKISEKIQAYQKDHGVVAISAAVIGRENHEKFHETFSYGILSQTSTIPVNRFSEFRIGPLTQIFTASVLAYMVKEGQVNLNDPISKFVPKSTELPKFKGKEITLGDLATHTSGLPDFPYNLSSRSSFSVSEMFRFLRNYTLKRAPGKQYEYSNLGYALLANLLSRISKRSTPDIIAQVVLHPLHLSDTRFSLRMDQKKRYVIGYENGHGIPTLSSEKIYSVFIGSGGLYSTAKDMLSWLSFNLGKETTSLNTLLPIMQRDYFTFKKFRVGLGWLISPEGRYFIQGSLFGFTAYMAIVPDSDIGVVLLSNQGDISLESLGADILEVLAQ